MAVIKRKLNAYQQKVRSNALALQKQANTQNRARIEQSNTAASDALSFNTKRNDQALKNSNDLYQANLSGMAGRVQDEAASQGNARGSYAGDYVRASSERKGYNRDKALAQQNSDNTADSLKLHQEQNTRNYQNALNEYKLELQRQKNEDWANTHYNYTAPKKGPNKPQQPGFARPKDSDAPKYLDASGRMREAGEYSVDANRYNSQKAAWDKYDKDMVAYNRAGGK